jgi:hypothetical protein
LATKCICMFIGFVRRFLKTNVSYYLLDLQGSKLWLWCFSAHWFLWIFPGTTIWAVLDWLSGGFFGWAVGLVDWSVAGYAASWRVFPFKRPTALGLMGTQLEPQQQKARLASRQGLPVVNSSQLIWMLVDHIYIHLYTLWYPLVIYIAAEHGPQYWIIKLSKSSN